jgi:hypothetical protein
MNISYRPRDLLRRSAGLFYFLYLSWGFLLKSSCGIIEGMENSNDTLGKYDNLGERASALTEQGEKIQIADTPLTAGAGEEFKLSGTEQVVEKKEVSKETVFAKAKEFYKGLEPVAKMEAVKFLMDQINNAHIDTPIESNEITEKKAAVVEQATKNPSGAEALSALTENYMPQRTGFEPAPVQIKQETPELAPEAIPEQPEKVESKKQEKIEDDPNLIMVTNPGDTLMGNMDELLSRVPEVVAMDPTDKEVLSVFLVQTVQENPSKYGWPDKLNINPIIHAND